MSKAEELKIHSEPFNDGVLVRPIGEIDLSCAAMLRQQLAEAQRGKPKRLIIDLHEVPYMDSSGVATLVEAMQISRRNATRLVLCNLQPKVRSILEMSRLDTVFAIAESLEEAKTK